MELRELTELEERELHNIKVTDDDNGYKILFGMMAIDLMDSKIYETKLKYDDFIDYIDDEQYQGFGFSLMYLIKTWLIKIAKSNKQDIDNKMIKSIECLVICFINTVCAIGPGISGIKYRNMVNLYEEIENKIRDEEGKYIMDCPEINYRYIVSCLEYMGLQRKPKNLEGSVDMTCIYYSDLF